MGTNRVHDLRTFGQILGNLFLYGVLQTAALDVVPGRDDDVSALGVFAPEVGAGQALAAVPAAVLVEHHVVLARHQLVAVAVLYKKEWREHICISSAC